MNVTTAQRYSINQLAAIQSMDGGPSLGLGAPGTLQALVLVCRLPSRPTVQDKLDLSSRVAATNRACCGIARRRRAVSWCRGVVPC